MKWALGLIAQLREIGNNCHLVKILVVRTIVSLSSLSLLLSPV